MYLDVKINNVPVQLEVKNVGPASLDDIDEFREKLKAGDLVLIDQSTVVEEEKEDVNPYFDRPVEETVPQESPSTSPIESENLQEEPEPEPEIEPEIKPEESEDGLDLMEVAEDVIESLPEIVEDVQEIFANNPDKEVTEGKKPWYKSKTVISNVLATAGCILGVFVSDDPQTSMYLPATVLAMINLGLRFMTTGSVELPMEKKIKKFVKKD